MKIPPEVDLAVPARTDALTRIKPFRHHLHSTLAEVAFTSIDGRRSEEDVESEPLDLPRHATALHVGRGAESSTPRRHTDALT